MLNIYVKHTVFRIENAIKKKRDKLYVKWKAFGNSFIVRLMLMIEYNNSENIFC